MSRAWFQHELDERDGQMNPTEFGQMNEQEKLIFLAEYSDWRQVLEVPLTEQEELEIEHLSLLRRLREEGL